MYFHQEDGFHNLKQNYIKLFLESYFDICFCCVINMIAFVEALQTNTIGDHFATWYDAVNSASTLMYTVLLFYFPLHVYRVITDNFEGLELEVIKDQYGLYYEDYRTKTKAQALYNVFFLQRRLLTTLILVFVKHVPFFQVTLLLLFSTVNFIYTWVTRPLHSRKENAIELFNELTIMLCCHVSNLFLNLAIPLAFRGLLGWILMGIAGFNVLVNLSIIIYNTLKDSYISFKEQKTHRAATKHFNRLMKNRKYLAENFSAMSAFKKEQDLYESLLFLRKYTPERKWLLSNNVDITSFEDELQYKSIQDKF
jgi:hypothetical protein